MDSGTSFDDIISPELAEQLNLRYGPPLRKAGTADQSARCAMVVRMMKLIEIHLENIPGTFTIRPYLVRNLAHPINLGQSFPRHYEAEMIFRPKGILLKLRNGATRLTDRSLELTRPIMDLCIQQVIGLQAQPGKNPCVTNADI